jgi:hypothetical protein
MHINSYASKIVLVCPGICHWFYGSVKQTDWSSVSVWTFFSFGQIFTIQDYHAHGFDSGFCDRRDLRQRI